MTNLVVSILDGVSTLEPIQQGIRLGFLCFFAGLAVLAPIVAFRSSVNK